MRGAPRGESQIPRKGSVQQSLVINMHKATFMMGSLFPIARANNRRSSVARGWHGACFSPPRHRRKPTVKSREAGSKEPIFDVLTPPSASARPSWSQQARTRSPSPREHRARQSETAVAQRTRRWRKTARLAVEVGRQLPRSTEQRGGKAAGELPGCVSVPGGGARVWQRKLQDDGTTGPQGAATRSGTARRGDNRAGGDSLPAWTARTARCLRSVQRQRLSAEGKLRRAGQAPRGSASFGWW